MDARGCTLLVAAVARFANERTPTKWRELGEAILPYFNAGQGTLEEAARSWLWCSEEARRSLHLFVGLRPFQITDAILDEFWAALMRREIAILVHKDDREVRIDELILPRVKIEDDTVTSGLHTYRVAAVPFAADDDDGGTGSPGRKAKGKKLINDEFERRIARGEVCKKLHDYALSSASETWYKTGT
jgi:hypothetical protein